jgi:hypothetical protein
MTGANLTARRAPKQGGVHQTVLRGEYWTEHVYR